MYYVCIFSPSNAFFIEFITVCSLVLITSCNVNPRFLLRLHDSSVLQFIIIFNAKSLRINVLCDCFIDSSTNSHLCFLCILLYLLVIDNIFLRPNCSSIFFSFSHNLLRLFVITYVIIFICFFLVISTILYILKKKNFSSTKIIHLFLGWI